MIYNVKNEKVKLLTRCNSYRQILVLLWSSSIQFNKVIDLLTHEFEDTINCKGLKYHHLASPQGTHNPVLLIQVAPQGTFRKEPVGKRKHLVGGGGIYDMLTISPVWRLGNRRQEVMVDRTRMMTVGIQEVADVRNTADLGYYGAQMWGGIKEDTKIWGDIVFLNKVSCFQSWR